MVENSLITTSIRNWNEQNMRLRTLVEKLTAEQLQNEIAPGRNTGVYLVGHFVAINYNIVTLFGLGQNPKPELDDIFLFKPDKAVQHGYTAEVLKAMLYESIETLQEKFSALTEADLLDRHTQVSAEDFLTQPHRNKINVLISRTLHLAYHLGQLALLK